jgi:hypothetical protein
MSLDFVLHLNDLGELKMRNCSFLYLHESWPLNPFDHLRTSSAHHKFSVYYSGLSAHKLLDKAPGKLINEIEYLLMSRIIQSSKDGNVKEVADGLNESLFSKLL